MQRMEINRNVRWMKLHGKENPQMNRLTGRALLTYAPELNTRLCLEGRDGDVGIVTTAVKGAEEFSNGLLIRTLNSVYFIAWDGPATTEYSVF